MTETEDIVERLVTLPLFPHMTDDQVDRVAAEILEALAAQGGSRKTMRVATHSLEQSPPDLVASPVENLPK